MSNIRYSKTILESGVSLIELTGFPSGGVTVGAFIRAGFSRDPKTLPGLAHFTEHMMFRGTKSFPSAKHMAKEVESFGGWRSAFTWINHQSHIIHMPTSSFKNGFELLIEALTKPLLKESDIEKEKGTVYEELIRNLSDSQKAVWDYAWTPLIFQGTELARPYSGTKRDVGKMKSEYVRKFLKDNFSASNTFLVLAGDFDSTLAKKIINSNYKKDKSIIFNFPEILLKKRVKVYNKDFHGQCSFILSIKVSNYVNADRFALEILQSLLSGRYGSSLVQELNDKGLIYDWTSFIDYTPNDGFIIFSVSCASNNLLKILKIVVEELNRLGNGRFSIEEIEETKKFLSGNLILSKEKRADFVDWYGIQAILDPTESISVESTISKYQDINFDNILIVAKKYFKIENISIAVAGKTDEKKIVKLLS